MRSTSRGYFAAIAIVGGAQVGDHVTRAVALSPDEQFANVVQRVAARHDRRFAATVGAELSQSARRHQSVAETRRLRSRRLSPPLRTYAFDRFGGAAISRRAVGVEVGLAQVAQVTFRSRAS